MALEAVTSISRDLEPGSPHKSCSGGSQKAPGSHIRAIEVSRISILRIKNVYETRWAHDDDVGPPPRGNSQEPTILLRLSWTESSWPAKTSAIPAHSGVCRVQQSQRAGATPSRSSTGSTKPPADDATATRWPSRVLLLVERRGGGFRASCAMDLIHMDAAGSRNRRFRAVGEQQHCCAAAVRARPARAGRPTSACLSSPRATGLSPEPHPGCVRKLSLRTSQPRPQRRGVQAKDFPQIGDERRFSRVRSRSMAHPPGLSTVNTKH